MTPNLGINRTPKQRRFACCLGAGHAKRWASRNVEVTRVRA